MAEGTFMRGYRRASDLSWRFLVIAAALVVVALVVAELRLIFIPMFVALLVSTILVPPTRWLQRRGLPPLLATLLVLVGAIAAVAVGVALIAPQVGEQADDLGRAVERGTDRVLSWLAAEPFSISQEEIDQAVVRFGQELRANAGGLASGVAKGALALGETVAGMLLAFVLIFFFVKDGGRFTEWAKAKLPASSRARWELAGTRAWSALSSYIRGSAIIGLVDATLVAILLLVVGAPLVVPLAVLTFFGAFFPLVGAVVAGAVAALIAWVAGGLADGLIVAAGVLVIQQVEGDVLAPVVLGRAVKLHPVVILVVLTAGALVAGIPGAFFAVPVTAVGVAVASAFGETESTATS